MVIMEDITADIMGVVITEAMAEVDMAGTTNRFSPPSWEIKVSACR
jgi:hypothetical protein